LFLDKAYLGDSVQEVVHEFSYAALIADPAVRVLHMIVPHVLPDSMRLFRTLSMVV
jgi:hypothetical protein